MVPFLGICDFVKKNIWLSVIGGILLLFVLFGKQMNRLFRAPRKRRRKIRPAGRPYSPRRRIGRSPRSPIRSVGMRKRAGKGYPAAGGGTIPYKYNKNGTVKKAWQVSGTVAAKRRMSQLRRRR